MCGGQELDVVIGDRRVQHHTDCFLAQPISKSQNQLEMDSLSLLGRSAETGKNSKMLAPS